MKKLVLFKVILVIIGVVIFFLIFKYNYSNVNVVQKNEVVNNEPVDVLNEKPEVLSDVVVPKNEYTIYTVSETQTVAKLKNDLGDEDFKTTLSLNRLDKKFIGIGSKLVIPKDFSSNSVNFWLTYSPFPNKLDILNNVPKIVLISQKTQAMAVYENSVLVRSGPVSTGKKSTQTPNGLFNANWKAKKSTSTVDSSWILPWVINLDNFEGVSMHQYELPGRPASHSCIRMREIDAKFVYDFVDQWQLSTDGNSVIKKGTPVIIFGNYSYESIRPWLNLVNNPEYLNISEAELVDVINNTKVLQ